MIRYGNSPVDDMRRMKIARESRGYDGRWLWQARAVAATAGTLFIRAYERGERGPRRDAEPGLRGIAAGGRYHGPGIARMGQGDGRANRGHADLRHRGGGTVTAFPGHARRRLGSWLLARWRSLARICDMVLP